MREYSIREDVHLDYWNHSTIRVYIGTSFEEIPVCFERIQHDYGFTKDMER
jgi:hypothetical protein